MHEVSDVLLGRQVGVVHEVVVTVAVLKAHVPPQLHPARLQLRRLLVMLRLYRPGNRWVLTLLRVHVFSRFCLLEKRLQFNCRLLVMLRLYRPGFKHVILL